MSEQTRENFFILLGIDPKAPWSDEKFKQSLQEKRADWTKKSKLPGKKGAIYREYLALTSEIEAIMTDASKRKEEAERAIATKQETPEKVAQENLLKDLETLGGKGFIEESEIAKLATRYNKYFDESFIKTEISKKNLEIRKVTQNNDDSKLETLKERDLKRIKGYLETLGKKDLYDFLELSRTTTNCQSFIDKAESIYKQSQGYGHKDTKTEAQAALGTDAKTIFATENSRRLYDNSLEVEKYKIIEEKIKNLAQNSFDKILHLRQFDSILKKAQSSGIKDLEKARNLIIKYSREKGLIIQAAPDIEIFKQKIVCVQCDTINDRCQNKCTSCGSSLRIECPSCKTNSAITDRACPKCAFPIGNEPNVRSYLKEAQELINNKDYDQASIFLNLARQGWSTIPPRSLTDDLSKAIEHYGQEIAKVQQVQIALQKQLNDTINDRRYYEARNLLKGLQLEANTINLNSEQKIIEDKISQAEAELAKARTVERQGGDPIEAYQNVLWICKDCKSAKDALAKTPPSPAMSLSARSGDQIVSLSWKPSTSKNVKYTVVLKYNSRPISSNDGEQLATVSGTIYDDTKMKVGVPVYYAIYTNREGVFATSAADLKEPVLLIDDVFKVIAQARNKEVSISWQPPNNVSQIHIYRTTERLSDPTKGKRIEVISTSQVVDRNLENGKKYYYTIYSLFKSYKGKLVSSKGVSVEVIPEEPPSPIKELQLEVISTSSVRKLKLSWELPRKGDVVVIQSNKSSCFSSEEILPQGALTEYGKVLEGTKEFVTTTIEEKGVVYFTPVLLFQTTAYIGKTLEYVNVDDVSNLKVQKQKNELHLRWDWPSNCQQVIVSYSDEGFPSSDRDSRATHIELTKAQYNLKGYYPLKSTAERDYFIVAHAVLNQNGQVFVASGLSNSARTRVSLSSNVTIQYQIGRKRKLFGKGQLLLTIHTSGIGQMPELILIRKQGSVPIKKTNGDEVFKIPATTLSEEKMTLTYEIVDEYPCNFGKLFLIDEELYESKGGYVRINHPASNDMEMF
ncbi:MAG: hypothetical protein N4J56_007986 [Chroococcidiopsis sp. SAG 2025]|uniref:zinc ribbon domain-containing protein n=1 Tax=Chroococcidiopsis sp. SAG 2025 TaxID=171389 RepID=UPI002936D954|nr:zinc ribbon domain-containing protein [Chroococcidiopsis sp. SAG 2025]MDV2998281.1 hypothetical protein [Chroococcidiopsis sp. SAG 2025]